jgi:LPXTG-motif cell wall-anchored protein
MALPSYDPRQFNKSRKPIEAKPIDAKTIEQKKEVIVEPAKKNNLPMIIGVVVIGAILYFIYKKK